jgi:hypothetical protein
VAAIDSALEDIRQEWLDLVDLRRMAVRRHGDTVPAPTMPTAPAEPVGEAQIERDGFDGNVASLIARYKTDPNSSFRNVRYRTREHYESLMRRIERDIGSELIRDIDAERLKAIYKDWNETGVSMAFALVGMLRGLASFGARSLKSKDCLALKFAISELKFQPAKPRIERLTAEQITAIIGKAREMGLHSIALAQAFQFDCGLRQKDVIGDWVPISEPGDSDVIDKQMKWLRGIRWDEIDKTLILRHTTSWDKKLFEYPLSHAPTVMTEFARIRPLPRRGPIIVDERTSQPYRSVDFRRIWRTVADAVGIPNHVKNMDYQGGAIANPASLIFKTGH